MMVCTLSATRDRVGAGSDEIATCRSGHSPQSSGETKDTLAPAEKDARP